MVETNSGRSYNHCPTEESRSTDSERAGVQPRSGLTATRRVSTCVSRSATEESDVCCRVHWQMEIAVNPHCRQVRTLLLTGHVSENASTRTRSSNDTTTGSLSSFKNRTTFWGQSKSVSENLRVCLLSEIGLLDRECLYVRNFIGEIHFYFTRTLNKVVRLEHGRLLLKLQGGVKYFWCRHTRILFAHSLSLDQ